jgi:hypothetical protein
MWPKAIEMFPLPDVAPAPQESLLKQQSKQGCRESELSCHYQDAYSTRLYFISAQCLYWNIKHIIDENYFLATAPMLDFHFDCDVIGIEELSRIQIPPHTFK